MEIIKSVKVAVKIGSHLTKVYLNDDSIICEKFIKIALIQCNVVKKSLDSCVNTYALFERLNGIEVIIRSNENIYNLWSTKWKNDKNVELIIKKYRKSKSLCKIIKRNQTKMQRLFKNSNKRSSKINEYLVSAEDEIKNGQMELKKNIRQFINFDASYFENVLVINEKKMENDVINNYFGEINELLIAHFGRNIV
jgi:hypothetical protein